MGTGQTCTKTLLHGGSLCMKGHFYTRVKTVKYKTLQKKTKETNNLPTEGKGYG